jgi:uncharacterized membrane protein
VLAYSQTVYDWLKTFHVVAAVIWVGGDVMLLVLARRIVRANDPRQKAAFVHDVGEVGQRFIAPTSLVVIAFALALVIYSPAWNFSDPWIAIAIAGYLATFVTGAFITGPTAVKIDKMVQAGTSPDDPGVQALIDRTLKIARVDVAVLLLIVVDMVLKPGK